MSSELCFFSRVQDLIHLVNGQVLCTMSLEDAKQAQLAISDIKKYISDRMLELDHNNGLPSNR